MGMNLGHCLTSFAAIVDRYLLVVVGVITCHFCILGGIVVLSWPLMVKTIALIVQSLWCIFYFLIPCLWYFMYLQEMAFEYVLSCVEVFT